MSKKMSCYPYKIDGLVTKFNSPLGGFIQGDVQNRYDVKTDPNAWFPTYEQLYPQFSKDIMSSYYVKRSTIPPPSLYGIAPGLKVGEYVYRDGYSYQNNQYQKPLNSDQSVRKNY